MPLINNMDGYRVIKAAGEAGGTPAHHSKHVRSSLLLLPRARFVFDKITRWVIVLAVFFYRYYPRILLFSTRK